jgi:hypothetical protein
VRQGLMFGTHQHFLGAQMAWYGIVRSVVCGSAFSVFLFGISLCDRAHDKMGACCPSHAVDDRAYDEAGYTLGSQ